MGDPLPLGSYPQFQDGGWTDIQDVVSREEPLAVVVRGLPGQETPRFLWAHPEGLETLVLGHVKLELCGERQVPVLAEQNGANYLVDIRLDGDAPPAPPPEPGLTGQGILDAMEKLMDAEGHWQATGCFHRAGLYDAAAAEFLAVAQDIGRHNCLDRLAGWALKTGTDPRGCVLVCSARLTASLAAKVRKLGCVLAVSRSAITTGALQVAQAAAGQPPLTIAGFTRQGRTTVFADHAGRIAR